LNRKNTNDSAIIDAAFEKLEIPEYRITTTVNNFGSREDKSSVSRGVPRKRHRNEAEHSDYSRGPECCLNGQNSVAKRVAFDKVHMPEIGYTVSVDDFETQKEKLFIERDIIMDPFIYDDECTDHELRQALDEISNIREYPRSHESGGRLSI